MQLKKAVRAGVSVAAIASVMSLPFVSLNAFGHGSTGDTKRMQKVDAVETSPGHLAIDKYVKTK